jgi:hypothetical protein
VIPENYTRTVVFIYRPAPDDVDEQALGTGFVVSHPDDSSPNERTFIVTADHVVPYVGPVEVVMPRDASEPVRFPVEPGDWRRHPHADVAITEVPQATLDEAIQTYSVGVHLASGVGDNREPSLGERVFFIGLLRSLERMGHQAIAVVRFGTMARLNQINIRVRRPGAYGHISGHLIDCRVYGGMSGAPCFMQYGDKWPSPAGGVVLGDRTVWIGLVSGHFDEYEPALVREGSENLAVDSPINTGIGIVTPAGAVLELIEESMAGSEVSG